MRLLFVVHQFLPEFASGTEQVTLALAKAAQRAGHRADVLTCSLDPGADWLRTTPEGFRQTAVQGLEVTGIPAAMLPEPVGFSDGYGVSLRQSEAARARLDRAIDGFLDRGDYDLVHGMHAMRMLEVLARLRARGLPYLLTLTDFFLLCYRINLVRQNGGLCDGPEGAKACARHCAKGGINLLTLEQRQAAMGDVLYGASLRVACSPFVAAAFQREHPDLPVTVIGHGLDLLRMRPRAGRDRGEHPVVFGYLGTVSEAKGVDILLRAFARSPARAARLDLVGPPSGDAAFIAELTGIAAQDSRIRLRGPLPSAEVPAALAGFDVLCLPSRLPETFSLALHEGFAAGLPALVADLGHPSGVVRQAGCGMVVPDGDEAAWTAAITEIAQDPTALDVWRSRLPLPARVEEEAFLYSQLYRACIA
jgi:glycosyltransferase involved in cell wall biosynthesis